MNEPEVLDALVAVWQRDIAPTFRRDCCIAAARATSLVLDYYGIGNRVLACEAFVFNQLALDQLEAGNEDYRKWPEGAWSIGVGRHSPGAGYSGHLIVRTASGALVDLSASQFNRPGRIEVDGPRVWQVAFTRGDIMFVAEGDDVLFTFRPSAGNEYRKAKDWARGREVAARIIRTINNERMSK